MHDDYRPSLKEVVDREEALTSYDHLKIVTDKLQYAREELARFQSEFDLLRRKVDEQARIVQDARQEFVQVYETILDL